MSFAVLLRVKKLVSPDAEQVSVVCNTTKRLFIRDSVSNRQFLIDSGSDISIITPTLAQKMASQYNHEQDLDYTQLFAANGSPIKCYGRKLVTISLGLRREFSWRFIIADVTHSIIGADFLTNFGLLLDLRHKRIIDTATNLSTSGFLSKGSLPQVTTINSTHRIATLLNEFKEIFNKQLTSRKCTASSVTHHIETKGPPVTARARRLSPNRLAAAKAEFNELMRQGICRPSKSNYASPLHMVKKPNGEWRPCGDYRRLNSITVPDRYPIPHVQDFTGNLHGKTVVSRVDMTKAFHHVPVEPNDIPKTAIITPFGLFEFVYMTFGFRNAAQTFQRLIDEVVRGLDFAFAYLDDILIASVDEVEHMKHLRILFQRISEYGLNINLQKCEFFKSDIEFVGHLITPDGIKPRPEKVEAIRNFPKPTEAFELKRFLAMVNFYRRFIPNAIRTQDRPQSLIKGNKKNDRTKLVWTDDATAAFDEYKQMLSDAALLAHPAKHAKIIVGTDASDTAIGGVVHQCINDTVQPLAFFSRKLNSAQMKYSTYDRELLAIYETIKHFRYMLEGRDFEVFTDHKPLVFAFQQKPEKASPRQARQLDFIGQFTSKIRYVQGKNNVVPDFLSRINAVTQHTIDYERIASSQLTDEELQSLLKDNKTSLDLKLMTLPDSDAKLYCDVSAKLVRPFVTESFRTAIIEKFHGLSHPGVRVTCKLVKHRFVWPNINRDVNKYVKHCIACQKVKTQRHTKAPITRYDTSSNRFEHINVDIVGPLTMSQSYIYLLTIIDRCTRWPEAIPLQEITAESVARALVSGWISRFGVPHRVTTDQGRQFESHLFKRLNEVLGTSHLRSSPYHPQGNGMIERWHRTLKASLKAKFNADWVEQLPLVLLGLRSALKPDINASPAELTYGKTLTLPGEFFEPSKRFDESHDFVRHLRETMRKLQPIKASHHSSGKFFVHPELSSAKFVFVRNDAHKKPLQAPYNGPFEVLKHRDKVFKVNVNGKAQNISIDRLKPAFVLEEDVSKDVFPPVNSNQPDQIKSNHPDQIKPNQPEQINSNQDALGLSSHTTTRAGRRVRFPDRLKF